MFGAGAFNDATQQQLLDLAIANAEGTCTCCAGEQQLMLASAAQDKYLRVWRIQHEAATTPAAADAATDTQDLAAAIARQVPEDCVLQVSFIVCLQYHIINTPVHMGHSSLASPRTALSL